MSSEDLPGSIQRIYAFLRTGVGILTLIAAIVGGIIWGGNVYFDARKKYETAMEELSELRLEVDGLSGLKGEVDAIIGVKGEIVGLRADLEKERAARATGAEERGVLSATIATVETRLSAMEAANAAKATPSVRFIPYAPHRISPSAPGRIAQVVWHYIVERACGRPTVVAQMRDAKGFEQDMSLVGFSGTASKVGEPLKISYRLRTPSDAAPGAARHWVLLEYDECPTVRSPEIEFEVLPPRARPDGAGIPPE